MTGKIPGMMGEVTDIHHYQQQVERLERELDEMTIALSQAWDQLVPFLQQVPMQAETGQDILPILQAVSAAADTELAGIYLFQSGEWYTVPDAVCLAPGCEAQLASISQVQTLGLPLETGQQVHWAFAPVVAESEIMGVLGIGTYNTDRCFTSVDLRIIVRMAERIGSQVAAAQLARFREREAIQAREMQIANEIQQSVQPVEAPCNSHIRMASYWQPAKEVGGDTWGWVQQDDGRLAWFILDVAGKGLPAALAAVALHTAISMALRMRVAPADVLRLVNEQFYEAYTRTDLIATAAIVSVNPANGVLELANAGHPPVLVRHGGAWLRLAATAPPIGVLPDLEAEPQLMTLYPGDAVICYSDGFTEIETPTRLWGQTGLLGAIPPGADDVQTLTDSIVAASRRAGTARDDQTLIAALYTPG